MATAQLLGGFDAVLVLGELESIGTRLGEGCSTRTKVFSPATTGPRKG